MWNTKIVAMSVLLASAAAVQPGRAQAAGDPAQVSAVRCFITSGCVEHDGEKPVPVTVSGDRDYGSVAQTELWKAYRRTVVGDGYLPYRTEGCRLVPPRDASRPSRLVVCRAGDGSYPSNPPFPPDRVPFWVDVLFSVNGDKVTAITLAGSDTWLDRLDRYLGIKRRT